MKSVLALTRKSQILSAIYRWGKSTLKTGSKNGRESKADVSQLNISTEVEADKLWALTEQGHNVPLQETSGFQLVKSYHENPNLKLENPAPVIKLYEAIKSVRKLEPVDVMATYDGKYIILNGIERVAAGHVLGFEKLPVRMIAVDRELLQLMELLRDAYPNRGQKALYTPIDHPVFSDWQVDRDDRRWILIKDKFDWKNKRVLDIGSYTGYFSHKIAKLGGQVTGIDIDEKRLAQAKRINTLLGSNVEFIHANFFEYLKGKQFDCILFFSVLHWILKDRGLVGVREAMELLSTTSPVLFFDMGQDNESKMRTQEWTHGLTINKETIPDLIIANSKYRYVEYLGTGDTGRDMFRFSRE